MRLVHLVFALALLMQSLAFAGPAPASERTAIGADRAADCGRRDEGLPAPREAHRHGCAGCLLHNWDESLDVPRAIFAPPLLRVHALFYGAAYRAPTSIDRTSHCRARAPPKA
ncbi:hypothetical protein [Methylocystis bryophila]|uniref:DUF2946 domain-containing protein n=1 Tax=Methylocystis bryophila TaxID=655015 RepID=A0A1W6MWW2_9HYPH|nr:hypothetical protein [Methylocystis bryophila]ARN82081.1 hypothetical protein B1812_14470 [Methylocystis bryophila]